MAEVNSNPIHDFYARASDVQQRFEHWSSQSAGSKKDPLIYMRQGMTVLVALGRLCRDFAKSDQVEPSAQSAPNENEQKLLEAFGGNEKQKEKQKPESQRLSFRSMFVKHFRKEEPKQRFSAELAEHAVEMTEKIISVDALNACLELSLLRKTNPQDYENVRKLFLNFSSAAGVSTPVALATQTMQDLHSTALARVNRAVTHHAFFELAKLFRYPWFGRNADYFNLYVLELLREPNRIPELTPTTALKAAVLSYVMSPEPLFHDLLRVIAAKVSADDKTADHIRQALEALPRHGAFASPPLIGGDTKNPKRRLKIALCISGQLRGYKNCVETWKDLGLEAHDTHTFLTTWKNVGRRAPDPDTIGSVERIFASAKFCNEYRDIAADIGGDALHAQFPRFLEALSQSSTATEEDLKASYGQDTTVHIDDEADTKFAKFSNQEKMHYKIWAAQEMVRDTGENFDLVIRIRPDKALTPKTKPADWVAMADLMAEHDLLYAEEGPGLREHLVIGDQIAVSSMRGMNHYADTWSAYRSDLKALPFPAPRGLHAHASLGFSMFHAGYRVRRLPWLHFGRPQDERLLQDSEVKELLALDINTREPTEVDRKLLATLGS